MKVLLLTHRVPYPPNRGDRIRSYHLLKFLAARAEVSLACTTEEPVPADTRRYLTSFCEEVAICPTTRYGRAAGAATSLVRGGSATEGHFWSPQLAAVLRGWRHRAKFDTVICYCSGMFRYIRDEAFAGIPVVVDLVDVDSRKWLDCASGARGPAGWLYRLESRRVRQLEQELVKRSQAITVVSNVEADLFRELFPDAPVHTVANGVDLDSCGPTREDNGLDCVFVGALDYFPNVEGVCRFCREVWPQVHARFPQARFVIVGRQPAASIRRLAAEPGVHVVGEVPDVRPYLRQARLAVIPLQIARGIQNKVLEAMAAAKPVIASPQALEGLKVVPGEHVLQAEMPRDWVAQICALLQDQDECRRLGDAGRSFVSAHHRWEECLRPFEQILGMPRQSIPTKLSPVLS